MISDIVSIIVFSDNILDTLTFWPFGDDKESK